MSLSSYVDWPPECPLQEELIYLEEDLKNCTTDLKTQIRCRRSIIEHWEYPEIECDMYIDDIRKLLRERKSIKKKIFVFELKHGNVFY